VAEYAHAVRPGEHEVETGAHCCDSMCASTLGRELRVDAVETSAVRQKYEAAEK
jgi:hypothetical protein